MYIHIMQTEYDDIVEALARIDATEKRIVDMLTDKNYNHTDEERKAVRKERDKLNSDRAYVVGIVRFLVGTQKPKERM